MTQLRRKGRLARRSQIRLQHDEPELSPVSGRMSPARDLVLIIDPIVGGSANIVSMLQSMEHGFGIGIAAHALDAQILRPSAIFLNDLGPDRFSKSDLSVELANIREVFGNKLLIVVTDKEDEEPRRYIAAAVSGALVTLSAMNGIIDLRALTLFLNLGLDLSKRLGQPPTERQNHGLVSPVSSYTGNTPSPEAAAASPQLRMGETETIDDFAARKGMTVAQLEEAADNWKAVRGEVAKRETTGRASAEPRPKTIADAKAEALAIGDTTLLGQLVKYEARLASIELPAKGLKSPEQAKAASRLAKTYQDMRARQLEWGLDPIPKDDRATEAQRLASDFYRKHPKPKVKATRSSLRQRNSARTASPR